jgi:putative nucleotidyltransferase with HDIG domain
MDELKLIASLSRTGTVWLVGGFVRDLLLKRPLSDVDLAVKGDARKISRAFAARLKAKAFALDEERGVYRVVAGGKTFDFAELQGATIQEDLRCRDYTVNALSVPLEDFLIHGPSVKPLDLFDGIKDLKARRIRLVSAKALKDDPLRLLRAARLASELDFTVDPKTLTAMKMHAGLAVRPAPERVREELMKALSTPRGEGALRLLDKTGVLPILFPEAKAMRASGHDYYGKDGVLGHSLDAVASLESVLSDLKAYLPRVHRPLSEYLAQPVAGHPRFALIKLGELFHDVGKPATAEKGEDGKLHFYGHEHVGAKVAERTAARWRFSRDEIRTLARLVGGHMRPGNLGNATNVSDRAIYRFFRDFEGDAVSVLVMSLGDHFTYLSARARRSGKDPVHRTIARMLETFFLKPAAVVPAKIVDGNDLMKLLKIKPGPKVGEILEAIREGQATGKVKNREDAFLLARRLMK